MPAPHRRPALIVLVIVASVSCLVLAWWQWGRFQAAGGTAQNLGYALQWPLFAAFFVWAYFRFIRLERDHTGEESSDAVPPEATSGSSDTESVIGRWPARSRAARPREIPPGILPERPTVRQESDPLRTEYNQYLADLHVRDLHEQVLRAGLVRDSERSAG